MKMNVSDVQDRLAIIESMKGDAETAHGRQDNLFREVLTAVASGDVGLRQARAISAEALKVDQIEFDRWMA